MPIQFACPQCGYKVNAPDAAAGKRGKCPKCAAVVQVPAPVAAAAFEDPFPDLAVSAPAPATHAASSSDDATALRRPSFAGAPATPSMPRQLRGVQIAPGVDVSNPYQSPESKLARADDINVGDSAYELATPLARLGAQLINGVLNFLPVLPCFLILFAMMPASEEEAAVTGLLMLGVGIVSGLILLVAQTISVAKHSASLGKKILGLQVVDAKTMQPTSFGRYVGIRTIGYICVASFVPTLLGVSFGYYGLFAQAILGHIISLTDLLLIFSPSRQCLHDRLAGTLVIKLPRKV